MRTTTIIAALVVMACMLGCKSSPEERLTEPGDENSIPPPSDEAPSDEDPLAGNPPTKAIIVLVNLEQESTDRVRERCEKGEHLGCAELAMRYASETGVPLDLDEAVRLMRRACDLGPYDDCRTALDELMSRDFQYGPEVAIQTVVPMCGEGEQRACDSVSKIVNVLDIAELRRHAYSALSRHCLAGREHACESMIELVHELPYTRQFIELHRFLGDLEAACDQEYVRACRILGVHLRDGLLWRHQKLDPNPERAEKYLEKAEKLEAEMD